MLDDESYMSLVTFRKDGSEVPTPVWFANIAGKLWVFTDGTSYKVKRLRKNPAVRVAACNMVGKVTGPWQDGTARIVEDESLIARAKDALRAKYGWQIAVLDVISTIGGRIGRRAFLAIDLAQD
jgi:PPOX class probable F420-dependent enzyme